MIFQRCKKMCAKIVAIIVACSAITVLIIGSTSIIYSKKMIEQESEARLLNSAIRYSAEFSLELQNVENQVKEMQYYVQKTLNLHELQTNPDYLKQYSEELAPYILYFAKTRTNLQAAWIYFDPKWSKTPQDIHYLDDNADMIPDRQNHLSFSYFDNIPEANDDKYWWYGAIDKKGISWTNPSEWTLNNKTIQVSACSMPIYIDGEFIGVVGTYHNFDILFDKIQNIKLFQNDYAILLNDNLGIILHPNYSSGSRYTCDNLATIANGQLNAVAKEVLLKANGIIPYTLDGDEKFFAYSKLNNSWTLALTPYLEEAYVDYNQLIWILIYAVLFCILLTICIAILSAKYITKPILEVVQAAKSIGEGKFDLHIKVQTNDEIGTIANSLNDMLIHTRQLKEELEHIAYDDELTGGINLHKFKLIVIPLIESHPELRYMMVKFDIDRFKLVNELYGFELGDKILISLSNVFKSNLNPECDCFARIGSDEFIALISFVDYMNFEIKYKAAYDEFIKSYKSLGSFKLMLSEGRYLVEKDKRDFSEMFEKVNFAHKIAKSGENKLPRAVEHKICYYDGKVKQLALEEKEIENKMDAALANSDFKIYLQPKYDINNGQIVGAEALVRWHSSDIDIIYPNNFIPIFEKNGFIAELDMYMLEESCKVIKSWIDSCITPIPISVNFSRIHLNNKVLVQEVCSIVDKYNLPHNLIEIEITETVIFDNMEILEKVLAELHEANFTLSMDDFGTGYSSLGLLKNLAVDVIKLDQSFFTFTKNAQRSKTVIASVISMAKELNIQTLAEGVENQADIDLLKELHCDTVQGYFFSKPMPANMLTKILEKNKLH